MLLISSLNEDNIYTLKNISELYNQHSNINKFYHFQYKTIEVANEKFGNFALSIMDKETHHSIYDELSCYVTDNKNCLVLKPKSNVLKPKSNVRKHVIAYNNIPENYRFDIITSQLDGKTLVIYDINHKETNKINIIKSHTEKSIN
jgi:hypothetical protein